tara:strand:+ start:286 stop:1212 length:927 start_codon:yes stop_codon:yes gene_type:complete
MKKTLITIFAAFALFASTAKADIALSENLTMYGYLDFWLDGFDSDTANSGNDLGVQELEIGFAWADDGPWSAVYELSVDGGDDFAVGGESTAVATETATVTYAASDSLSYTMGNILSYQGFEAFDATGLYQYSYSGVDGGALYSAAYAFGGSVDYATDDYSLGFWIGDNGGNASYEYLYAYTAIPDVTIKFIYADDPGYESTNVWGSYDMGDYTFAAEYYEDQQVGFLETDTTMFLVYKAMGDAGLTVRFVDGSDYNSDGALVNYERLTFSPSYAFSDSVFGLVEFTFEEEEGGKAGEEFAAEIIYSF